MADRASLTNIGSWPTPVLALSALFGALVFLVLLALGAWALVALLLGLAGLAASAWFMLDAAPASAPAVAPKQPEPVAPAAEPMPAPKAAVAEPAPAEPQTPAAEGETEAESAEGPDEAPAFKSAAVTSAAQAARAAFADLAGPGTTGEPAEAARKPAALPAPRDGVADDLKQIRGIGPRIEALLNGLGCYHLDQIAGWSPAEVAWIDANLEGFHGRATRDDWVGQARTLAAGGEIDASHRAGDAETG